MALHTVSTHVCDPVGTVLKNLILDFHICQKTAELMCVFEIVYDWFVGWEWVVTYHFSVLRTSQNLAESLHKCMGLHRNWKPKFSRYCVNQGKKGRWMAWLQWKGLDFMLKHGYQAKQSRESLLHISVRVIQRDIYKHYP